MWCVGGMCGCVGSMCGSVGGMCGCVGSMCGCVGGMCGCVGSMCGCVGGMCGCVGGMCGCVGSMCGCVGGMCGCAGGVWLRRWYVLLLLSFVRVWRVLGVVHVSRCICVCMYNYYLLDNIFMVAYYYLHGRILYFSFRLL